MLTINLEKELSVLATERENKERKFLTDSPEMLEFLRHDDVKYKSVINRFGTSAVINDIDSKLKKDIELKQKFSEETRKKIFNTSDIKKICNAYRLRFLPINLYKGTIDSLVPEKIISFEESKLFKEDMGESKTSIDELFGYGLTTKSYYIVAPAESFKLSRKPKDPLLFCYMGDGLWYLVCKWGNDLSVTRRVISIYRKYHFFTLMAQVLLLVNAIAYLAVKNPEYGQINFITTGVYLISAGLIFAMIHNENEESYSDKWKSEYL